MPAPASGPASSGSRLSQISPPPQSKKNSAEASVEQYRMRDRWSMAWRRAEPPNDARSLCEKRLNGADLGPEGLSLRLIETRAAPDQRFEGVGAIGDRRPRAFQPHCRRCAEPCRHRADLRTARCGGWQMRGAGNLEGRVQRVRQHGDRDLIGKTVQHDGARCLRFRHDFDGELGQRRQRAIGARLQFAHVVAGDVLDDLAAGLPDFAKAVHGGKAEDVVPRRSCAHAPRSGEIARDHAAKRRLALSAEKGAPVGRLESQHLALLRKLGVDRGKRRRPGCAVKNKFGGLVVDNSAEPETSRT